MHINIIRDEDVYLQSQHLQNGSNKIKVNIVDPLKHHKYEISFNKHPYQEINNNEITLPEFTNKENNVIINVRISQMGKVVKVLTSDSYRFRKVPLLGDTLLESFPIGLESIMYKNESFQKEVLKILKEFEQKVLQIENEGELI